MSILYRVKFQESETFRAASSPESTCWATLRKRGLHTYGISRNRVKANIPLARVGHYFACPHTTIPRHTSSAVLLPFYSLANVRRALSGLVGGRDNSRCNSVVEHVNSSRERRKLFHPELRERRQRKRWRNVWQRCHCLLGWQPDCTAQYHQAVVVIVKHRNVSDAPSNSPPRRLRT